MLYTYSVWLLMDVHLSECEQSSLHTKVAGLSRDRPHPAAQCKADILDPGAGNHSSQLSCSFIFNQRRFWPSPCPVALSGFVLKHSPYFSNFPFLTRCFCALPDRFLEHKRLYSSPSDLYRQEIVIRPCFYSAELQTLGRHVQGAQVQDTYK